MKNISNMTETEMEKEVTRLRKLILGEWDTEPDMEARRRLLALEKRREGLLKPGQKPEVGMGATYSIRSDAYPYTVVEVRRNGRTVVLQADLAYGTKELEGYGDRQEYVCIPNPKGSLKTCTLRRNGEYKPKGSKYGNISFGRRIKSMDPSY